MTARFPQAVLHTERNTTAKLSVEEPDAAEPARPDLWGARVSNDPGLPDPGMGSCAGPPTRRTVPASPASRDRGFRSASRSSAGRTGRCRSRRRGRARHARSCRAARWGGSTGRIRAPYMCTRPLSSHIAVPSPSHIPLACRAHQSECGRTPPTRGRHHKEDPSP